MKALVAISSWASTPQFLTQLSMTCAGQQCVSDTSVQVYLKRVQRHMGVAVVELLLDGGHCVLGVGVSLQEEQGGEMEDRR